MAITMTGDIQLHANREAAMAQQPGALAGLIVTLNHWLNSAPMKEWLSRSCVTCCFFKETKLVTPRPGD
jgi:hypothetical protein